MVAEDHLEVAAAVEDLAAAAVEDQVAEEVNLLPHSTKARFIFITLN
jgi:hypothetical protein